MLQVNRTISCLLALWLLTTSMGCATINLSKIDFRSRKASARNPAIKIVCLWEPAEGRDPKGVPCQGFAGQILFLTSKSLPVSVDGDIKIYLFDNHGTAEEQAKPLHEFNFDGEAWAQHYSYGSLGPCYNVFIPYMRKGVGDATCALRLRLTPPEGQGPPVFSEMTSIELFGNGDAKKVSTKKSSTSDSRVEQTVPEDLTSVNKRRRTTTIVLNSKEGVPGDAIENPQATTTPQVQQASYQAEEVKPLTEADARMAQLEQMVQQLQAQQKQQQQQPATAPKPTAPAAPPRLLDESPAQPSGDTRSRIKVRSINHESADDAGAAKLDGIEEEAAAAKPASRQPAATERRVHPLEDEVFSDERSTSRPVPARRRSDVTIDEAPKKRSASRHPLEDESDEVKPVAARKTVRVLEPKPAAEPKRKVATEAFEPIETERHEEPVAEGNSPARVRLRSAN